MADNSQGSNSNGLPSPSLPGGDSVLKNATGQYTISILSNCHAQFRFEMKCIASMQQKLRNL